MNTKKTRGATTSAPKKVAKTKRKPISTTPKARPLTKTPTAKTSMAKILSSKTYTAKTKAQTPKTQPKAPSETTKRKEVSSKVVISVPPPYIRVQTAEGWRRSQLKRRKIKI